MYRIRLLAIAVITTIFVRSASQTMTKQIRARYPFKLLASGAVFDPLTDPSAGGGASRRNWRRVGKVQPRAVANSVDEPLPEAAERSDYRDPIAEYTSGTMRRTRVISPRYKSIFSRSKSLTGSEFIPNDMDAYTSKLAARRRQTFRWHPQQMDDMFVLN